MAKQITFSYKDQDYILEYTRRTVQEMEEREGFQVEDVEKKPLTAIRALFAGAFKAHHRFVKQDLIDEIYAEIPDKEGLIEKLAEMYNEPIRALLTDPDEKSEKKVDWKASW